LTNSQRTILRAYKYRFYPNNTQEEQLNQTFGCVRFIWNQYTASFNQKNEGPNFAKATIKQLKEIFPFLKDVAYNALEQKAMDFIETKKQFFSKNRKTRLGRMKFKKKGISRDSFRLSVNGFKIKSGEIHVAKIGKLKIRKDREWKGTPKSVTVSKNKCNQYFVSILVEETLELKQNTGRSIGIDLGLKDLLIASSGMKISNPRWFRKSQTKLKRTQQHLSRKSKGSNRYNKQRLKVAKIHQKITNQRNFVYHNLSIWLVNNYDTIIMEDLNVRGMIKNRKLSKSISDAAWSTLVEMIKYKATWYGKTFHQIDRFYPSSKTCSCCGHKLDSLELSVREWACSNCGTIHDRDLNAAKNILNKGLSDLYDLTSDELADYRRREELSPEVAIPTASSLKRLFSNEFILVV
jgi:putative transposase